MLAEAAAAASFVVKLVAPYIADGTGDDTAASVLDWLRQKLSGRAREALTDLEADPAHDDNQADLRKQLARELEAHDDWREQLTRLLQARDVSADQMTQTLGTGAKGSQIKGSGNKVTIS
jgi:hypothetical protein